ncbi:MAG: lysine--tRNA ligase [Candidatus Methanomethylicaceae archaeon]
MEKGHWIRQIVDEIVVRGDPKIVIHTGKTPSGPIHIGAEREQFICSAIQRELKRRGYDSVFNFIIDSYDPLKSIPAGIEVQKGFEEHIGKPLSSVPDPYSCHDSYAMHFADEFNVCQERLGVYPNIIYSHDLYKRKEMKDAIRTVLSKLEELRAIRKKYIQRERREERRRERNGEMRGREESEEYKQDDEWNPVMVVCERCGRIASKKEEVAPNRLDWWDLDTDMAGYRCTSCGYEGRGKISDLALKLSWRVDWAAKWAIFRVSCEPAGKDHCVKDGAYDMGLEVCSKIFGYRGPLKVPYEWLTLGEHAMKTHKGITFTPREWLRVAPPECMRYMILNADPMRHIAFLPDRIPDIVDGFDRLERIYFGVENPPAGEDVQYYRDLYELCVVGTLPEGAPVRLPYRFCAIIVQLEPLFGWEKVTKKSLEYLRKLAGRAGVTDNEESDAVARLRMAKNWVEAYAPQNLKFRISMEVPPHRPSDERERAFINSLISLIEKDVPEAELQNEIFNSARSIGLEVGRAFSLVYLILLGAERGPRLAPLLTALDKEWLIKRLRAVL